VPRDFRKIEAWRFADDLAVAVYDATKSFPADERYGLTQQLRRAAVSVPSNIAEGAGRATKSDYLRFCSIGRGSLAELRYQLHLACRLGYLDEGEYTALEALADRVGAVLHGLMQAIESEA